MAALIDRAISLLTRAKSAWNRGHTTECIRCLGEAGIVCKDAVREAAMRSVS